MYDSYTVTRVARGRLSERKCPFLSFFHVRTPGLFLYSYPISRPLDPLYVTFVCVFVHEIVYHKHTCPLSPYPHGTDVSFVKFFQTPDPLQYEAEQVFKP